MGRKALLNSLLQTCLGTFNARHLSFRPVLVHSMTNIYLCLHWIFMLMHERKKKLPDLPACFVESIFKLKDKWLSLIKLKHWNTMSLTHTHTHMTSLQMSMSSQYDQHFNSVIVISIYTLKSNTCKALCILRNLNDNETRPHFVISILSTEFLNLL